MKNKFLIPLISGLVTIGIFGCSSSPSDKIVGIWEAKPPIESQALMFCGGGERFEFKNQDDNIVLYVSEPNTSNNFKKIGVAEQNKENPNTFKLPFGQTFARFTYFKSDDSLSFTIQGLCPEVTYHRVK